MTEAVTVNSQTPSAAMKSPIEPPLPRVVQGVGFVAFRRPFIRWARKRYGPVFAVDIPFFRNTVYMADPSLVRQVFTASPVSVSQWLQGFYKSGLDPKGIEPGLVVLVSIWVGFEVSVLIGIIPIIVYEGGRAPVDDRYIEPDSRWLPLQTSLTRTRPNMVTLDGRGRADKLFDLIAHREGGCRRNLFDPDVRTWQGQLSCPQQVANVPSLGT